MGFTLVCCQIQLNVFNFSSLENIVFHRDSAHIMLMKMVHKKLQNPHSLFISNNADSYKENIIILCIENTFIRAYGTQDG